MELLLVADKLMVGYHGKENVETYILTVMNIVSQPPTRVGEAAFLSN